MFNVHSSFSDGLSIELDAQAAQAKTIAAQKPSN
jgi:hypothetical protein